MSRVKEQNYITIQAFMVNDLKLKGNDLIVYAIIFGFSQTEGQTFNGSLQYLADWTNSTKQGVLRNLKSLLEKKLIAKNEKIVNNLKCCEYYSTNVNGIKQSLMGYSTNVNGGIKQSLTNNIDNNIEYNNSSSSKEQIVDLLQDNGFIITPLQYETIDTWCNYDYELIKYVLLQSLNNNIRNINYIDKVLYNYSKKGIITKGQAIADDEVFKNKKKSSAKEKEEKHGIYDNLAEL